MTAYLLMGASRKFFKVTWGEAAASNEVVIRVVYSPQSVRKSRQRGQIRSGVWGGAPAENEFGAFSTSQNTFGQDLV